MTKLSKRKIIFDGEEKIVMVREYLGKEVFCYKHIWFFLDGNNVSKTNYIKEGYKLYPNGVPSRLDLKRIGIELEPKFFL